MNAKMQSKYLLVCVAAIALGPAICAHAFQASGLPDPSAPTPKIQITLPSKPGTPPQVQSLPAPGVARAKAAEAVQCVASIAATATNDLNTIQRLNTEIANLDAKIAALIDSKEKALNELRSGLYCSKCHRTKTEIEKSGEDFWKHLKDVDGKPIPASQAEIDAKAKEFDQQIAQAKNQQDQDRAQIVPLQRELRDAWYQIQQGIDLWQAATTFEKDLVVANEAVERDRENAAISFADERLRAAQAARDKLVREGAAPSDIEMAGLAIRTWQQSKEKAEQDAAKRLSFYFPDLKDADEVKNKEYVQITSALSPVTRNPNFSSLSGVVPSFSITVDKVSLSLSPTQLGASFRFGKLFSGGVSVGAVDAATTEASSFISFMGRVRLSAIWRTQFRADGTVLNYPTGDLTILPGSPDKKQTQKPPQGQNQGGLPIP